MTRDGLLGVGKVVLVDTRSTRALMHRSRNCKGTSENEV